MLYVGTFLYINRFAVCSWLSQRESQERFRTETKRKKPAYDRNHRSVSMFYAAPPFREKFFYIAISLLPEDNQGYSFRPAKDDKCSG